MMVKNTDWDDLTTMSELIEEDNYELSNLDNMSRILKTLSGTQYKSKKNQNQLGFNDFDLSNRSLTHFERIGEKFYYIESSTRM